MARCSAASVEVVYVLLPGRCMRLVLSLLTAGSRDALWFTPSLALYAKWSPLQGLHVTSSISLGLQPKTIQAEKGSRIRTECSAGASRRNNAQRVHSCVIDRRMNKVSRQHGAKCSRLQPLFARLCRPCAKPHDSTCFYNIQKICEHMSAVGSGPDLNDAPTTLSP